MVPSQFFLHLFTDAGAFVAKVTAGIDEDLLLSDLCLETLIFAFLNSNCHALAPYPQLSNTTVVFKLSVQN